VIHKRQRAPAHDQWRWLFEGTNLEMTGPRGGRSLVSSAGQVSIFEMPQRRSCDIRREQFSDMDADGVDPECILSDLHFPFTGVKNTTIVDINLNAEPLESEKRSDLPHLSNVSSHSSRSADFRRRCARPERLRVVEIGRTSPPRAAEPPSSTAWCVIERWSASALRRIDAP